MNSILLKNYNKLKESLKETVNAVDLDYRANREDSEGNLIVPVIRGASPMLNEYKLWLQSSKTDYIRNYEYGGFFNLNLNEYPFSPDSEERIAQDLRDKTAELFPNIYLMDVQVKCMSPERYWRVKVVVADKETGMIAADMENNGESIIYTVNSVSKN